MDTAIAAFVGALGDWGRRPGPAYRRLAAALREAVGAGRFAPGTTIPPERALAAALGVSRTTVVGAYGQLRAEGWLESVQGSGTRVARGAQAAAVLETPPPKAESARSRRTVFRGLIESGSAEVAFLGLYLPAASPDLEEAMAEVARDPVVLEGHGYTGVGLPALREAIAAHLTAAGFPTRGAEILVTNGAQQAIGLAAALALRPGDAIAIEDPTYLGAIDLFEAAGARIVPVAIDERGLRPADLAAVFERARPRAAYLMPTFQNPVGSVLSADARREIARSAEKQGVTVIEDVTLDDLAFGAPPPPPIGAFARDGVVMTIGSLSKLIWGGLRVGWLRAPESVIEAAAGLKVMSDLGNSPIPQAIAARLLERIPRIRARRRKEIAARRDALASELARRLPEWRWTPPQGGLSLWVRLPRGNAEDFGAAAARHGVAILPGSTCSPTRGSAAYLRLPFCLPPDEIRDGVRRLARAWKEYEPEAPRRPAERPLHVVV